MKILIRNGRVIDPANNLDEVTDVLIENGKISKISKNMPVNGSEKIDAAGKIVMPGIVDLHVHLREPGRQDKETVASGTRAALKGGVTSLLAMPNTTPAMDSCVNLKLLKDIVNKSAQANVFLCGAITAGRLGKELAEIKNYKKEGVLAISDDGSSVDSEELLFSALKEAARFDLLVVDHCEDKKLSNGGCVNLGFTSTRLGLRGISKESEFLRVKRDIELAQNSGARMHICHVSCSETVEIIAKAKLKGVKVTAEVAPHHFALTDESLLNYDPNYKMNPPLRSKSDMLSLRQGLSDGTIDAIASDHAPHTENEKEIEFERAEFGVVGVETELSVSITELINKGVLDWPGLVRKLSLNPAKILGVNKGSLSVGSDADLVVIDANEEWLVEKLSFVSKSKNSAFLGKKLKGVVEYTICSGKVIYKR